MDGFDILSIAFASNGIAAEWQITTQALGFRPVDGTGGHGGGFRAAGRPR